MNPQRGFVVPALLISIALGAILWQLDAGRIERAIATARAERTRAALAEARDALVAYAMTYALNHATNPRLGLLPCPDAGNDGKSDVLGTACGGTGTYDAGRFPHFTVAVPRLREGSGDCLWYLVAGSYKNAGGGAAAPLNWDTPGQFDIVGSGGQALTSGSDPHARAIAVIVAPNGPLASQLRTNSSGECPGGGDAGADLTAFVDSPLPAPTASPFAVHEGQPGDAGNNDALAWVTPDDVFGRLMRTSYFAGFLTTLTSNVATALAATLPAPEDPTTSSDGGLLVGKLPDAATLGISDLAQKVMHDDWRPMFRYLRCTDATAPGCLTLNGLACHAILIFGGARGAGQDRTTDDLGQYLEEPTLTGVRSFAPHYAGPTAVDFAVPTRDVFTCVA